LWHTLFQDARFHAALLDVDVMVAAAARLAGCADCGGRLHAAPYARKPRGGPDLPREHSVRLSFCCAADGCRRRTTPPSLRFLGRRVYVETVVVLVAVLRHGLSPTRLRRLRELTGVSRWTVRRWCVWWRTSFAESLFWRVASAAFVPPPATALLPASLLECFQGGDEERLVLLLRFLGPITGGASSQVV